MPFDVKTIQNFPQEPGVYLMKDAQGNVLYVGKAKNLRQRVKTYFAGGDGRAVIPYLVSKIEHIETLVVTSEKEALLLENNLIKKHQPKYNALLKDDKSSIALKINLLDPWPKVDLIRYRGNPEEKGLYFGPYTSATAARETLDLILKLFPLRQCSDAEFKRRQRPCLLYQMKRCLGPCAQKCTQEEYTACVRKTIQFLKGQDKEVIRDLTQEMEAASQMLEFEKAHQLATLIKRIETTLESQHVDTPLGTDADAIAIYGEGSDRVLFKLVFRKGRLSESRAFSFSEVIQEPEELISSFLLQHYEPSVQEVREILLENSLSDASLVSEILSSRYGHKVIVHVPMKGEKKRWLELAQKNALAHFKSHRENYEKILLEMQDSLKLAQYPQKIECFDVSHTSGKEAVASLVSYVNGVKNTKGYRTYHIRVEHESDDYASMTQVLTRRYKRAKEEVALPDLVIIDGGKGHLNAALKVFEALNIVGVDIIGCAKEEGRHDKGLSQEQIFRNGEELPILLSKNSPVLFFIQNIRDEAHRFAITFHRKMRLKKVLTSALDDIPGIGPVKKKALLIRFGSTKGISEASDEELLSVKGITKKHVNLIRKKFGIHEHRI